MTTNERLECIIYGDSGNESTPGEPWYLHRPVNHWYAPQADFALQELGPGNGKCLVIGSPLFEAIELKNAGWKVTYLDVREVWLEGITTICADASTLMIYPESFDAASTTCVLCHAGLGRYGDPIVENADEKILNNIFNALKPGGRAAVTFGPVANTSMPLRYGNCHRIYNLETARAITGDFRILKESLLDSKTLQWIPDLKNKFELGQHYLSMLLEKP